HREDQHQWRLRNHDRSREERDHRSPRLRLQNVTGHRRYMIEVTGTPDVTINALAELALDPCRETSRFRPISLPGRSVSFRGSVFGSAFSSGNGSWISGSGFPISRTS